MEQPTDQKSIVLPDDLTLAQDGTALFTINEEGPIQGNYRGVFQLRCYLNPLDSLAAGRQFRTLLGEFGDSAGEQDRYTAFCTSQLAYRVIKGPPWWTANNQTGNIPDLNVLSILLDRCLTAEAAYKQHLVKRKEEALEKASKAAQALHESLNPKKEEEK
jgi:hypothetical protein